MVKKIIISLLLIFNIMPTLVYASTTAMVKIGNNYYFSLEEAIDNATSTDIITLISDIELSETLQINKTVNINLNGNDITAPSRVFQVEGGVLNVSGKGTIKETEPNYGAIMIKGSTDSSDSNYSIVNVGKDVTLEGWSGIFVPHNSSKAHGVVANLEGKINALDDINGDSGVGIYINGNIKHQDNPPTINIKDNAKITSTGVGLYIAGYTKVNIGNAYISGEDSGIGIKSGILNIDGATITCEGDDYTPTEGYNNGIKKSGTTIQIESNNGYAGNIELNIKNGTFTSKDSNVIYEYIGKGNTSQVKSINLSGGTYESKSSKETLSFSDSFKNKHQGFITGGKYSSNPTQYLQSGYTTTTDNDLYSVVKSTMKDIDTYSSNKNNPSNNFLKIIIIISISAILFIIVYTNKTKIFNLIKK